MKLLLLLAIPLAQAAELKPGLLGRATDGELTVHFIAQTPNLTLQADESIHPQLKPTFHGELSGFLLLENSSEYSFPPSPSVFIDGKNCAGNTVTLPAGQRRIRIPISRESSDTFQINLPFITSVFAHDREPRELKDDQSRDLGRQFFEDFNCAACHSNGPMQYRFTPLPEPAPKAKSMRSLHPTQGCLSEIPDDTAPKFDLTQAQRESLQLFLQTPDISPAPLIDFARQINQFKCADCHSNLPDFKFTDFASALLDHPGLTISTNNIAELSRNFAKIAAP